MHPGKIALVVIGLVLLSGCSGLPTESSPRYDVSVESVTGDSSQSRVIAITPPEDGALPKNAEVTVNGGYVTVVETSTKKYDDTAYLVYVPSRTKFALTSRLDGTVHGIDDANFTVSSVQISAHGKTETHEL